MKTHHIRPFLSRLGADDGGLALVEFAMALPILLAISLGGIELAHYAIAVERVSQIAMTAADNAARVRDSYTGTANAIDEVDVNEVMAGAKYVGDSIQFAQNGRIILSSIENNAGNTGQWIRWQRCSGAKNVSSSYGVQDAGKTDATLSGGVGPTGNKIAASTGSAGLFGAAAYDSQPVLPLDYLGYNGKTLRFTSAFNVRERTNYVLNNAKGLTGTAFSSCTVYSA